MSVMALILGTEAGRGSGLGTDYLVSYKEPLCEVGQGQGQGWG